MEITNNEEYIVNKLKYFKENNKISNILFENFHKSPNYYKIIYDFIHSIYTTESTECIESTNIQNIQNKQNIQNNAIVKDEFVIYVNCVYDKGIKFIREELIIFFAKKQVHTYHGRLFKSIVLFNADKLTIDAQSALRRIIEVYNEHTRFFIIVNDKEKLLKPIISRFSIITYVSSYLTPLQYSFNKNENANTIENIIMNINGDITDVSDNMYDNGYSSYDLIHYIETMKDNFEKYDLLITIDKAKKEIKNEPMLMCYILQKIKD